MFRKVFASSVSLAFVSVGFMLPGLVRTKMASLFLSAEGLAAVGQLSQTQTVLISLGAAGAVTATRVIMARNDIETKNLRSTQNWLLIVPTALSVLLAVIAVCFSGQLAHLILGSQTSAALIVAAAMGIPAAVLGQLSLAVAQVKASRSRLVIAAVTSALVGSVSVVLLMLPGSPEAAAWSFVAAPLAQLIVITLLCREARVSLRHYPRIGTQRFREVVMLGWSSASLGIFAAVAELSGRTVVVHEHGIASLAFYQPVVLIVTQLVGTLLSAVATSSLIETSKTSDRSLLGCQLGEIVIRLMPLIAAGLAFISAFAPAIIGVFFDRAIADHAQTNVRVALSGELARAYAWIIGSCLLPQKLRKQWLLNGMVTVGVQLCFGAGLGYVFGVPGLIASLIVANSVSAVFTHILIRRAGIRIDNRNLFLAVGLAACLAAASLLYVGEMINWAAAVLCALLLIAHRVTGSLERRQDTKEAVS